MALQANRITAGFAVTTQTAIQIHFSFPGMGAAISVRRCAPAGAGMRLWHYQFLTMAVDAVIQILMTGVTIFLVAFCSYWMRHNKIQRMNLVIQIIALVALQALMDCMTFLAFLFIRHAGDTMAPPPVKIMIRRFESFTMGMAFETIVR